MWTDVQAVTATEDFTVQCLLIDRKSNWDAIHGTSLRLQNSFLGKHFESSDEVTAVTKKHSRLGIFQHLM
jgi:hypothetical protein